MARERKPGPIQQLALIDGFVIDCLLNEVHQLDNEVTEFPVEDGSTISDNIRPKPLVVQMECLISDTPLEFAGLFRPKTSIPTDDAYSLLKTIREQRRLIEIDTSLEHYKNMAVESLSIPRPAGRGDDLRFNATFKQVELVQNIRGERLRVAIPQAQDPGRQYKVLKSAPKGTRYVDLEPIRSFLPWYDPDILAWRHDARQRKGGKDGGWDLFKGNPVFVDPAVLKLLEDEEGFLTDAILKESIGGQPVFSSSRKRVVGIMPGRFTIHAQRGQLR